MPYPLPAASLHDGPASRSVNNSAPFRRVWTVLPAPFQHVSLLHQPRTAAFCIRPKAGDVAAAAAHVDSIYPGPCLTTPMVLAPCAGAGETVGGAEASGVHWRPVQVLGNDRVNEPLPTQASVARSGAITGRGHTHARPQVWVATAPLTVRGTC